MFFCLLLLLDDRRIRISIGTVSRTNKSRRPKNIRIRLHTGSAPKCSNSCQPSAQKNKIHYLVGEELTDTFEGVFLIPFPLGSTPMNSWSPGTETKTGEATLQGKKSQIVSPVTRNRCNKNAGDHSLNRLK